MREVLDHPGSAPASAAAAPSAGDDRRHETLVFRLAIAAAALWVLDDAFWHREPGTAVGDHLISGLVPVALAAPSIVTLYGVEPRFGRSLVIG